MYETEVKPQNDEEAEIDLMEYLRKLWDKRIYLLKAIGIGIVVGLVIAFSVPRKYTVNVTLSPESGATTPNSLSSSITSMLGLGSANRATEVDALNVILFPNIVSSTPFLLELFDMQVTTIDGEVDTTFVAYLDNVKKAWWSAILALPGKAIGGIKTLFTGKEEEREGLDPFRLTQEQSDKVEYLRESIDVNVDNKTGITTVSVTLQDPLVTATVTDSVIVKLQEYITAYRVSKAQVDCDYWENLYEQRRSEYYVAQQNYANYIDANKGVILQTALTERERLQNEMNLAYQIYSQTATQLQLALAKVQEAKPVFAVVEPATVPLRPSGMSKKVMLVVVVFLAFVIAAVWVLFGREFWDNMILELKGTGSTDGQSEENETSEHTPDKIE